ncbi:hypothetical protein B5G10_01265 [Barnesiella sp. An55]|nr:hypothetical protein B5G10_01265 [Barnesiella sp. An55]
MPKSVLPARAYNSGRHDGALSVKLSCALPGSGIPPTRPKQSDLRIDHAKIVQTTGIAKFISIR